MAQYENWNGSINAPIYNMYSTSMIYDEDQITGVPYLIYLDGYPAMIIDTTDDYVDAPREEQKVIEAAFDILTENPEVFFGSEAEMDEDDWDYAMEGFPEVQFHMEMMYPPHPIRDEDAKWELQEMEHDLGWYADGFDDRAKVSVDELRLNARGWREDVPSGAPENAEEIAAAYDELATALEGDNRNAAVDAYHKVMAQLQKLLDMMP